MRLKEQLGGRMVFVDLRSADPDGAFREIADSLVPVCRERSCGELYGQLKGWLEAGRPGLARGVALPHARCAGISGNALCLARSAAGIDFGGANEGPVTIIAAVLTPAGEHARHLTVLARLARLLRESLLRKKILDSPGPEAMARALEEADEAAAVNETG
jgi:PTS system fructose-specific IIA component